MKKTGVGFIGSGFARRIQAPAFKSIENVELIGCSSPHNAKDFASEFSMKVSTNDWRELISHPDLDLICISSPPEFHYEQALFALENNKHVLCEKPFTLTTTQARTLADKASELKTLCLLDHEMRFTPSVRYLKSQLEKYALGEIFFASAHSELTFRNNPDNKFNWWSEKSKGGGSWGAIGSHLIDLLRHLVDEVSAADTIMHTGYKKRKDKEGDLREVTSDDIAASLIRFRSGAAGMIYTNTASFQTKFDVTISGEKGTLKMDINGNVTYIDTSGKEQKPDFQLTEEDQKILRRYEKSGVQPNKFSKAFFFYSDAIIRAIKKGDSVLPCAATFEDGYLTQQVLETGWQTP